MKIGDKYNWIGQSERLIYVGKEGSWYQFKKIGDPREVWCEVLGSDLDEMEETKQPVDQVVTQSAEALAGSVQQSWELHIEQADAIRELLDLHAPETKGNLQMRLAQVFAQSAQQTVKPWLPSNREHDRQAIPYQDGYSWGWNDCLRRIKEQWDRVAATSQPLQQKETK